MVKSVSLKDSSGIKGPMQPTSPFAGVWARIGLLFGVLFLIKILLLVTYRRYLFEIHWRIGSQEGELWVKRRFISLQLLAGLNLWVLGGRCAAAGMRTMRTVNFCVLGLGLVFIFLTFHAGDKNYLFPLMNGILTWKNISWYLVEDFCFGPPYLACLDTGLYFRILFPGANRARTLDVASHGGLCGGLHGFLPA